MVFFNRLKVFAFLSCTFFSFFLQVASANDNTKLLRLYHDSDWFNNIESSKAIWRGMETALNEINYEVQGYRIELVKKDHSGNVVRSLNNMKSFLIDDKALALVSGIHSNPLIKHRTFINENKILTLVPWAAGGPITRYPAEENWVFRVSVDDTKAGEVLVNYALEDKNCKSPHLLLENTGWGNSNLKSMTAALTKRGYTSLHTTRFDWNIKRYRAQSILESIISQQSDCILLVANANEGVEIAQVMAALPEEQRMPIISHWGITGSRFHREVNHQMRENIDLSFIQSCFSFLKQPLEPFEQAVFDQAKNLYSDINLPIDIRSPVGFIHAYDMTKILIAALKNISLTENMLKNRNDLRLALEKLVKPVEGLVKTYQQPFSQFSEDNIDAHEALGINNYCMAKYGKLDEVLLLDDE